MFVNLYLFKILTVHFHFFKFNVYMSIYKQLSDEINYELYSINIRQK